MVHKCSQQEKFLQIDDKFSRLDSKLDSIEAKLAVLVDLKDDIKKNSEFRIQSKSVVGFLAFIFTIIGGLIFWLFSKINS